MNILRPHHSVLKPYVKQIHQFKVSPQGLTSMTAIPTGNVFLSFVWGNGTYHMQRPNSPNQSSSGGLFISGQQFELAHHWVDDGEVNIIGLELTPNAIHQFFGVPQKDTTGKVLTLEDTWGSKASKLYQEVVQESNPARQLFLVEEFLCKRVVAKNWKSNDSISEAISLVNSSKGAIPVKHLATSLRISTRSLERRFLEAVGITPKAYCKIIQFNAAFKKLAISNKHILDIISETGYYDQPHFIHHFRKVIGMSPTQFLDEYEKFLYYFKKDNSHCPLDSMVNVLQAANKLYVF